MGQTPGCCTKQSQKDLGRKQVPVAIIKNIPEPVLKTNQSPLPNPQCYELYDSFHALSNPIRRANIKVRFYDIQLPQNLKQKTRFVWKSVDIWEYPLQRIRNLSVSQIKKRTFQQKLVWFRFKLDDLKQNYVGKGFNKLKVDPTNVLFSSYKNFGNFNFNLETKIIFEDDKAAVDAGGLFREWANLCMKEAFSADLGLFRLCQTDETAYKIMVNKANKKVFVQTARVLGFVIGKSLIERIPLNCYFNRTILRIITNQPVYLSDMYNYDIGLYNSLKAIRDNPISEEDLISFTARVKDPFEEKQKEYELKPDGNSTFVNEDNKQEFIRLMIKYYTYQSIRDVIEGLRYTLYQVIPYNYLEIFQPHEFQMVLCGRQQIDVEDWKKNTSYKGYAPNDPMIVWFWEIVTELDQTMRSNLLHFCTGSTKVPIQGFKYLECKRGKIKNFNIKCAQLNKDNPFPKGITCFNKLELPVYKSKEQLYSMLVAVSQQQIHDFGLDGIRH